MAYKDDMQIDNGQLLLEVERQPHLFHQAASDYADAQYEQEKSESELKLVKAEVDCDVRDDPGRFGLDTDKKPTEAAIANQVIQENRYRQANESLMEANHLVRVLGAAKDAFGHKKSMLEVAAKLFLAAWTAKPRMPTGVQDAQIEKGQAEQRAALPKRKLGKAGG